MNEQPVHGRGASNNPPNRFELLCYQRDDDCADPEGPAPQTQYFRDSSRSIIATNDSPDVGFDASINPYRGCEHGCSYCYARPTHEFLGFSAGLDFETKIMVKEDAPDLLRRELSSPRWQPKTLGLSGVTDPYQPIERRLRLTRRCLEVLAEFRNPVSIVTKNHLVSRDRDLLGDLARHQAAAVFVSIGTLDAELARVLEPRASHPAGRLKAISELAGAGVPVGVMTAPVIPGLTDSELPAIVAAAAEAGACCATYTLLRLPGAVAQVFEDWLSRHAPTRKDRVLNRLREMHQGRLNDPRFGKRMRGDGPLADGISALFGLACRSAGLARRADLHLSTAAFRRPGGEQSVLWEM
jgi:DNA repair photolyase